METFQMLLIDTSGNNIVLEIPIEIMEKLEIKPINIKKYSGLRKLNKDIKEFMRKAN